MMRFTPAVFSVEDTYQILVRVDTPSFMWARVDGQCFYDDSNGVMRSETTVHRMTVPAALLEGAKAYTICSQEIPERKAYFSQPEPTVETEFAFRPVPRGSTRAYLMSDAHCRVAEPIRAAQTFGEIDFLLLNGDMPENSDHAEHFDTIFAIAEALTHGEKPIVFARGNHDLRGILAERYTEFTPNDRGSFYYTFRLGSIWGIVLDCGEDKPDGNKEYGGVICCHAFRERETRFLEQVASSKAYEADGIETRVVLVHNPFTHQFEPPFDIEAPLYAYWSKLLREQIRPDVMLCGHVHRYGIFDPGSSFDTYGQPCTVVVAGKPGDGYFCGAGLTFRGKETAVDFTDSEGAHFPADGDTDSIKNTLI